MYLALIVDGSKHALEKDLKKGNRADSLESLEIVIEQYKEIVETAFSLRSIIIENASKLLQGVELSDSRPVLFCSTGIDTPIHYADFLPKDAKSAPTEAVAIQMIETAARRELDRIESEYVAQYPTKNV